MAFKYPDYELVLSLQIKRTHKKNILLNSIYYDIYDKVRRNKCEPSVSSSTEFGGERFNRKT